MAKILLVDDSNDFLEVQCAVLRHAGHEVQMVRNGLEALEKLEHCRFSVVVTDIMMPHMDGIEFIMELRKRLNYTKIIALTGGSWIAASLHLTVASSLGAIIALSKPVTGRQLLNAIQSTLGQSPSPVLDVECPVAA